MAHERTITAHAATTNGYAGGFAHWSPHKGSALLSVAIPPVRDMRREEDSSGRLFVRTVSVGILAKRRFGILVK